MKGGNPEPVSCLLWVKHRLGRGISLLFNSFFDYIVFPNQPVDLLTPAFPTYKRTSRRCKQSRDDAIGTVDPAWPRLISFFSLIVDYTGFFAPSR